MDDVTAGDILPLLALDLHCHLLPALDDGVKERQECLDLARALAAYGLTQVCVTPHIHADLYPNRRETIVQACAETQAWLAEQGISLRLIPGAEVRLDPDSCRPETWLTLADAGRHMLVELPPGLPLVAQLEQQLDQLQAAGITPIIAHPERQGLFQRHPELLERWVLERGILTQGTLCTLAGAAADRTVGFLEGLLQRGLVHFLGTDAHHLDRRIQGLEHGITRLHALVGDDNAMTIRFHNPDALLRGHPIQRPRPVEPDKPPSLLARLIGPLRRS
ncbi:MAG: CpsB/CapC family capsule biosynthesis tyrosine phosphatase [Candidatus Sericytochromatia bacterium]|nr:CpsB/CapC family capsule biosynthesis tyrosine phosphatase [Candidatus Sericytochromatia bacterium]